VCCIVCGKVKVGGRQCDLQGRALQLVVQVLTARVVARAIRGPDVAGADHVTQLEARGGGVIARVELRVCTWRTNSNILE
jgi:hypothetical protein